jgi:hypothetical protein
MAVRAAALVAACVIGVTVYAAKSPQVEPNHMRWKNHDAILNNAVAWQEERDGRWVTVVVLTDRPIAPASVAPGKAPSQLMEEAKAQGIAIAIMSGGIPLAPATFEVAYRDGAEIRTTTLTGAGGIEIETASAAQMKGRLVLNPFTLGAKDENAWLVNFNTPVLNSDARRTSAEGEVLGNGGGQIGTDFQALLKGLVAMDYAAISSYASADLADLLKDPGARAKNLQMLKSMTPPAVKIFGGLRSGNTARLYWAQQWPAGADSRCTETLMLQGGTWRSIERACQAE